MQVSPSGMAAASQAASGEFDSRHLLQLKKHPIFFRVFFTCNFLSPLTPKKISRFSVTCSKISRLKRREIFLLSQLLANAEENQTEYSNP